jgi:hypothetical protein
MKRTTSLMWISLLQRNSMMWVSLWTPHQLFSINQRTDFDWCWVVLYSYEELPVLALKLNENCVSVPAPHVSGTNNSVLDSILPKTFHVSCY